METSQTLLVIGAVTGGVILSAIADHMGRKPMVLSCACALGVTAALSATSQSYIAFAVARYFVGVFYSVRAAFKRKDPFSKKSRIERVSQQCKVFHR